MDFDYQRNNKLKDNPNFTNYIGEYGLLLH